jgi:AraC-like DNA-binding protein
VKGAREKIELPVGHSFRILRWNRGVDTVDCVLEPGRAVQVSGEGGHWHFHLAMELTWFAHGEGTRFIGDHIGPFRAGDLVLLGENLPHYWHTRGASQGLSIQWHFPESHPLWAFPEALPLGGLFLKAGRGLRITGETAAVVTRWMHDLSDTSGVQQLGLFLTLLSRILAAPGSETESLSRHSFALSDESNYQSAIAGAVRHLIAHFREEVRIEDLLLVTDMSRATFARQFKKHSGKTFSEFLNQLRLQAACRELCESDRSVLDLSMASGFSQLSFFNRLFRRELGCSPTEYRNKAHRKASNSGVG